MITRIFSTENGYMPLFIRTTIALVIFPHGAQKMLGWFGGYGFSGTMAYFEGLGIPYIFGLLAILAEFAGALMLLAGAGARIAALTIAVNMITAAMLTHLQYGFFMDWGGTLAGEGFEYHILMAALCTFTIVKGAGALSVDRLVTGRAVNEHTQRLSFNH